MDELDNFRKQIDEIDRDIAILLDKRFSLCYQVSKYKQKNDMAILDSNREKCVLENVSSYVENPKVKYIKTIYFTIMDESKRYEKEINK